LITLLINLASSLLIVYFLGWLIIQKRGKTPASKPNHAPMESDITLPLDVSLLTLRKPGATIGRGPYLLYGAVLMAVKYNRAIAIFGFQQTWLVKAYFDPYTWQHLQFSNHMNLYLVLGLVALPFLWAGLVLTIRRLRDLRLSPLWALLFFIPFINLLFFILLSLLPTTQTKSASHWENPLLRWLDGVIPDHPVGSAALGVLITTLLGLLGMIGATSLGSYGWGLFLGLPFCMGLFSTLIYSYQRSRTLPQCLSVALISVGLLGAVILALAFEGVICLVMAAPLAAILALMGGVVGYALQKQKRPKGDTLLMLLALLCSWPLLMGAESQLSNRPPVYAVQSVMDINAPPETVWNNVVTFSQLPEPTEWVFHTGIAYPIRAEIQGRGPGAIRHCIFSTGEFVEPIEVWDEPHQLGFGVKTMPLPMHEWSYKEIHPPHLDQYLQVTHGEFRLQALPHRRTRLIGTTWYSNRVWPSLYWKGWSDGIIHTIHLRVLRHIKNLSEKA
jgi:uncharacterized membrane protein YhaH (DUF805 family)